MIRVTTHIRLAGAPEALCGHRVRGPKPRAVLGRRVICDACLVATEGLSAMAEDHVEYLEARLALTRKGVL